MDEELNHQRARSAYEILTRRHSDRDVKVEGSSVTVHAKEGKHTGIQHTIFQELIELGPFSAELHSSGMLKIWYHKQPSS